MGLHNCPFVSWVVPVGNTGKGKKHTWGVPPGSGLSRGLASQTCMVQQGWLPPAASTRMETLGHQAQT